MTATRTERDTFGPIEVSADRLWGAQTQSSLQNFAVSTEKMPRELVLAERQPGGPVTPAIADAQNQSTRALAKAIVNLEASNRIGNNGGRR